MWSEKDLTMKWDLSSIWTQDIGQISKIINVVREHLGEGRNWISWQLVSAQTVLRSLGKQHHKTHPGSKKEIRRWCHLRIWPFSDFALNRAQTGPNISRLLQVRDGLLLRMGVLSWYLAKWDPRGDKDMPFKLRKGWQHGYFSPTTVFYVFLCT